MLYVTGVWCRGPSTLGCTAAAVAAVAAAAALLLLGCCCWVAAAAFQVCCCWLLLAETPDAWVVAADWCCYRCFLWLLNEEQ